MKQIGPVARWQYSSTFDLLVSLFDPLADAYTRRLAAAGPAASLDDREIKIQEGQLTWLVYIIGSVTGQSSCGGPMTELGGPNGHRAGVDDPGDLDGPLICRCLQLMRILDEQLRLHRRHCSQTLELALLNFVTGLHRWVRLSASADPSLHSCITHPKLFFSASYFMGEQAHKSMKVQLWLKDQLGLEDELMLLNVLMQKIITNLQYWDSRWARSRFSRKSQQEKWERMIEPGQHLYLTFMSLVAHPF